jgi:hypothetical protein
MRKLAAFLVAGSLGLVVGAFVPVAFAQALALRSSASPARASGGASANKGFVSRGAPSSSGGNSSLLDSGATNPETGANNYIVRSNTANSGTRSQPGNPHSAGMSLH